MHSQTHYCIPVIAGEAYARDYTTTNAMHAQERAGGGADRKNSTVDGWS